MTGVWFQGGGHGLKDPAEEASAHQQFKRRVHSAIKATGLASTKPELDQQQNALSSVVDKESGPDAVNELEQAENIQRTYQQQRQSGPRAVGVKIQKGLAGLSQLVAKFSNIIEAVGNAGAPYAQIGYQTLSILLIVFVTKTQNDDRLVGHFEKIAKAMPDLETWKSLYPTSAMKELVAGIYNNVIEFSRAAAQYYCSFRKRIWMSINPLASIAHDEHAAEIYKLLSEVSAEALLGLHKRSSRIELDLQMAKQDGQKLLTQNENLKRQLDEQDRVFEESRRHEDESKFRALEDLLGIRLSDTCTDVDRTRTTLLAAFPEIGDKVSPRIRHTAYQQMSRVRLRESEEYQDWIKSSSSSILYLSGRTHYDGKKLSDSFCWLSPASIYLAQDLRAKGERMAFFSCHPDIQSEQVLTKDIIGSLVLQVLKWNPKILRERNDEYRRLIEGPLDDVRGVDQLAKLLEAILSVATAGTIYIIIDRPDFTMISRSSSLDQDMAPCARKTQERPIRIIMDAMYRIISNIRNPDLVVKVAVIVETSLGMGDWNYTNMPGIEDTADFVFGKSHWDQAQLSPQEKALSSRPRIWSHENNMVV